MDVPAWEATAILATFDVGRHIKFVPSFSETEVDKYFSHFMKAMSFKWLKETCTLLYRVVLLLLCWLKRVGNVNISATRELVPEVFWQKFRNTKKTEKQIYVQCEREKRNCLIACVYPNKSVKTTCNDANYC